MTRNIHAVARMILAAFGFVLLVSACDTPTSGKTGGLGVSGSVTLAKFDAIKVDPSGDGGMTPAQVISVMGFEGARIERVNPDFSFSPKMIFRESSSKHITVNFNKNQRARSKELSGIQVLTPVKYQSIRIGAANGSTLAEVNSIMGFKGLEPDNNNFSTSPSYYWSAGSLYSSLYLSSHRVTVAFNANGKATSKSLRGGFPGMVTLEKYNQIVVGPSTGMDSYDINRIMGFSGSNRSQWVSGTSIYRWAESAEKYIEVEIKFNTSGPSRAISARASGLPGAVDKP